MFPAVLIQVLFVLLIVGVLLWGLAALPVIDASVKQIIKVVIVVVTAIWLIYILTGLFGFPIHR